VRRSGRIAKEIPIVLIGTDETGRVFSEQSTTVALSRHGAGIVSRHKFAPEEMLTLRFGDPVKEADVRLVGQMGETDSGFIYGVEFLDPRIDYWGISFPPAEEFAGAASMWLECTLCQSQEKVEPSEVETDVFVTTGSVFRFCERCGQTTPWRKPAPGTEGKQPAAQKAKPSPKPTGIFSASEESSVREAPAPEKFTAVLEVVPAANTTEPQPETAPKRRENRRKHVRTRVSFMACVRFRGIEEETVACENISKGGLCFLSRKRYPENAWIEVAAPYEPGTPNIFVPAEIRHAEKTQDGEFFRYGVAYRKHTT
jgi:hypothetical protein